ncbi:hypothetical protein ACNI3K_06140 [Demequina sp. SO4-13]|uniref:hypothetical protein n=1 Tax=Demequina sp. SO4-13 TaxID=3401027 RepID=UPI003AF68267
MAMTVRMTAEQDAMVTALAKRWGVSKNEAILRAVEESASNDRTDAAFTDAYEHVSGKYRDALDRLGSV